MAESSEACWVAGQRSIKNNKLSIIYPLNTFSAAYTKPMLMTRMQIYENRLRILKPWKPYNKPATIGRDRFRNSLCGV